MDQAERDLTSTALQPLQAVLETLKMVTDSRWLIEWQGPGSFYF